MHILSPETDNCPSWISGRERMTVENISWSISTKECCRPRVRGGFRGCSVEPRFDWKFHFHGKNLINLDHHIYPPPHPQIILDPPLHIVSYSLAHCCVSRTCDHIVGGERAGCIGFLWYEACVLPPGLLFIWSSSVIGGLWFDWPQSPVTKYFFLRILYDNSLK